MRQKMIFGALASVLTFTSCNNQPEPKKEEKGVHIEGKKGGDLEINKGKLEINGQNGGKLKIDSNGAGAVAK
jgi:uncharacterized lipoprotein NlpE involved in copper resistance